MPRFLRLYKLLSHMAAENLAKWIRFGSDEERFKNDLTKRCADVTSRCDASRAVACPLQSPPLAGSCSRLVLSCLGLLCDLCFAARMFSRLQAAPKHKTTSTVIFVLTFAVVFASFADESFLFRYCQGAATSGAKSCSAEKLNAVKIYCFNRACARSPSFCTRMR
jgi:hypothetical protein